MSDLPPLPPGFTLDQQQADSANGGLPPLPPGFTLDKTPAEPKIDPSEGGGSFSVGPWDTGLKTPQWLDRMLAGAGKAYVDIGRGAGQFVGAVSREDVAASRERDAPLMRTGAGKVGNVVGNVAITLPALAIPGANTAVGAGLVGTSLGLLQPSTSTRETLTNAAVGGATSAAGQWLGNKISSGIANRLAAREAAAQSDEAANAVRDAVLKQSRAEGYVIPPTAVNPSATATALESISGKAATRQTAEHINAKVSNRLIAQDLNLAADAPITRDALAAVRKTAGAIYGHVEKSGPIVADSQYIDDLIGIAQVGTDLESAYPGIGASANKEVQKLVDSLAQPKVDAKQAVNVFRFLNERAKSNFKAAFSKGGDVQALELARAQRQAADAVGELIERNLSAQGKTDLYQSWQAARTTIAKASMAEAALKGNNIDSLRLAAQMRKGAYLSGGFKKVAEFADQFGEVARVPKSGAGVSKLAATVASGGAVTALLTGHPELAAGAAAVAAAPYGVRNALLSRAGQNLLATPSYSPGVLGTNALRGLGAAGEYGALPAYSGGNALIQSSK